MNEEGSGSIDVILNDYDLDIGDTISFSGIVGTTIYGTLTMSGSIAHYVPNANFCGTDTFTYQIVDSF